MERHPTLERRAVLALGTASVLSACAPHSGAMTVTSEPAISAASSPTGVSLPAFSAWHPQAGEEQVEAKIMAVRRIEALGNTPGHRLHVIDAQYGGLLSRTASVLVVCQSWHLDGAVLTSDGHTFDVRLSRIESSWRITAIRPSTPGPPVTDLSSAARSVLMNPRITLPPAARADVESGLVHDSALEAMATMARRWRIGVSVIRSGHPLYVFGTTRLSDHPRGRAFDTWAINEIPVLSAGAVPPVVPAYMEALASAGSYNVGGPVLLGPAPQFFSDLTHHDHVHAGFLS